MIHSASTCLALLGLTIRCVRSAYHRTAFPGFISRPATSPVEIPNDETTVSVPSLHFADQSARPNIKTFHISRPLVSAKYRTGGRFNADVPQAISFDDRVMRLRGNPGCVSPLALSAMVDNALRVAADDPANVRIDVPVLSLRPDED